MVPGRAGRGVDAVLRGGPARDGARPAAGPRAAGPRPGGRGLHVGRDGGRQECH